MRLKKIASGFLLGFGILFLLTGMTSPFDQSKSPEDRVEDTVACLFLGMPLTIWGGWLAWQLQREKQQQEHDRLRAIFFQMLQQGNATINVLQFAMNANIAGTAAKQFLDEQAKEFSADFEVDDRGEIFYRFNPGQAVAPAASLHFADPLPVDSPPANLLPIADSPNESAMRDESAMRESAITASFDVILISVPSDRTIAVLKVVRELTGCSLKEAVDLVDTVPQVVKRQVTRSEAERSQQQLQATGAIVQINDRYRDEI
jgi:ribosomal protein L7/L12